VGYRGTGAKLTESTRESIPRDKVQHIERNDKL